MTVEAGTLLEARSETPVSGIAHWDAPLSTGFDAIAPAGTRLRVIEPALPGATAIGCTPVGSALAGSVPLHVRRDPKYSGFHLVVPTAEVAVLWRVLDPLGPERTLLEAVRVLHARGVQGIQVMPYHYATGHWRCSIIVGGAIDEALVYSSAMEWRLPGRAAEDPTDPEAAADALWTALDDERRAGARHPDPAYAFWFSAMLDRCFDGMLPSLWGDYEHHLREGFVRLGGFVEKTFSRADFPLPPGDVLARLGA